MRNLLAAFTTACVVASISYAGTLVDQGQPGRQGPWPVYIQLLPDGGGGTGGGGASLWADAGPFQNLGGTIQPSPLAVVKVPDLLVQQGNGGSSAPYIIWQAGFPDGGGAQYQLGMDTGGAGPPNFYFNSAQVDGGNPQAECQWDSVGTQWKCNAFQTPNYFAGTQFCTNNGNGCMQDESGGLALRGGANDDPTSVGVILETFWYLFNPSAKMVSIRNGTFNGPGEVAYVDTIGGYHSVGWNYVDGGQPVSTQAQIQETLTVTAATSSGFVASGNEIIARQDGISAQGFSFTRAKMVVTCLTAGVGGGTTTLTLRDDTAPLNLTTVTFNCACTPGASSSAAVVTGLTQPDNDIYVIRTSGTANTDCSTFPTVVANGMLSRN